MELPPPVIDPHNALEFLQNIIDLIPGHIYWKDKNFKYLGCNLQQANSLGLAHKQDIIGKTDYDLTPKPEADLLRESDKLVTSSNKIWEFEEEVIHKNGERAIMLSRKTPLIDNDGNVIGLIGVSLDITERKKTEKELRIAIDNVETSEEANKIKSDFIASIRHDLVTPLNIIKNIASVLLSSNLSTDMTDSIKKLDHSTDSLIDQIKCILDFSRLEAGRIQLRFDPYDARKLIENIVDTFVPQAEEKNIQLQIAYPDTVPCHVISDPYLLSQIMINLLDKVIKESQDSVILINAECEQATEVQATVAFTISMNAVSVSQHSNVMRITNSMGSKPANISTLKNQLNLSIVKRLVAKLGGKHAFSKKSSPLVNYKISIPFKLQPSANILSYWQQHYANTKLLLVDDSQHERNLFSQNISCRNLKSTTSIKALDMLIKNASEQSSFQIICINNVNIETTKVLASAIKQIKLLGNPMLILFTNPVDANDHMALSQAGINEFFIKPIHPSELMIDLSYAWSKWLSTNTKDNNNNSNKHKLIHK